MRILGLIPARGGSKGVPGKNIKVLAGKPLIAYTIQQAQASSLLTRTILSTDDVDIANVAKSFGLDVPFMRPAELARDESGSLEVVQHALGFLKAQGEVYDAVCLLQVTSPYRPEGIIDDAIRLFQKQKPDSLISLRKVPDEFNPHWTFELQLNNRLKISTGEGQIIPRRQELPAAFHRDGSIYLTSVETIMKKNSLLGDDIVAFPIDSPKLINIDTMEDWGEAEAFFSEIKRKEDLKTQAVNGE